MMQMMGMLLQHIQNQRRDDEEDGGLRLEFARKKSHSGKRCLSALADQAAEAREPLLQRARTLESGPLESGAFGTAAAAAAPIPIATSEMQSAIAEPDSESAIAKPLESAIAEPTSAIAKQDSESAKARPDLESAIAEPENAIAKQDPKSANAKPDPLSKHSATLLDAIVERDAERAQLSRERAAAKKAAAKLEKAAAKLANDKAKEEDAAAKKAAARLEKWKANEEKAAAKKAAAKLEKDKAKEGKAAAKKVAAAKKAAAKLEKDKDNAKASKGSGSSNPVLPTPKDAAAAIPEKPTQVRIDHEASRTQYLVRTGLKGPGQTKSFKYGDLRSKEKALAEAKHWANEKWLLMTDS